MENKDLLEVFERETQCEYKDRQYLVRDNGAICRLPKEGCRLSKLDNIWSFGTKNSINGYMVFTGNIRVHQVVCTAFHGPEPQPHMVVDHIDTNRSNNRPENLRWLTRLENALNNDATRKKIIYLCGSVEAFIENPSILREKALPPDVGWMRTVTKEEAAFCKKHIDEWAARDSMSRQEEKGLGEWLYSNPNVETEDEISLTPGAIQFNWKYATDFLLCPREGQERSIKAYYYRLQRGELFTRNKYGWESIIEEAEYIPEEDAICVLSYDETNRPWKKCRITLQDGFFVHILEDAYSHSVGGTRNYNVGLKREGMSEND